MRSLKDKAQSTLEYAVIMAVIAAAIIATSIYVKRGIAGKFKRAADEASEGASFSPTAATFTNILSANIESTEESSYDLDTEPIITSNMAQSVTGTTSEHIGKFSEE